MSYTQSASPSPRGASGLRHVKPAHQFRGGSGVVHTALHGGERGIVNFPGRLLRAAGAFDLARPYGGERAQAGGGTLAVADVDQATQLRHRFENGIHRLIQILAARLAGRAEVALPVARPGAGQFRIALRDRAVRIPGARFNGEDVGADSIAQARRYGPAQLSQAPGGIFPRLRRECGWCTDRGIRRSARAR